jgi:hypothetical protein
VEDASEYSVLKPDMKFPELANFLKNGTNKDGLLEVFEMLYARRERV